MRILESFCRCQSLGVGRQKKNKNNKPTRSHNLMGRAHVNLGPINRPFREPIQRHARTRGSSWLSESPSRTHCITNQEKNCERRLIRPNPRIRRPVSIQTRHRSSPKSRTSSPPALVTPLEDQTSLSTHRKTLNALSPSVASRDHHFWLHTRLRRRR